MGGRYIKWTSLAAPGVGTNPTQRPSWSWSIIDCREFIRAHTADGLSSSHGLECPRAQVLDIQLKNINDDPFGQVESGHIIIQGPWRKVTWPEKPTPFLETYKNRRNILERHRFKDVHPDRFTEPNQIALALDQRFEDSASAIDVLAGDAIYLQINRFGNYDLKRRADVRGIHALVLQPTGGNEDEWRRIGIAQIPEDEGMADDWPVRVVRIV